MKIVKILLFIFSITINGLLAQSVEKDFDKKMEEASALLDSERYSEALKLYLPLEKSDSLNPDLNFNIGICYLNSRTEKIKAIT